MKINIHSYQTPVYFISFIFSIALTTISRSDDPKQKSPASELDGYRFEFPVLGKMPEKPKKGADGPSALVKGDPKKTDNLNPLRNLEVNPENVIR